MVVGTGWVVRRLAPAATEFALRMSNGELTAQAIKTASGQYDLECVRRLTVTVARLTKVGILEKCVNLRFLNLSNNRLSGVDALAACVHLERLDVSRNALTALGPAFAKLAALAVLDARGNSVTAVRRAAKDVAPLAPTLVALSFKDADGSLANPLCGEDGYEDAIRRALPRLDALDGSRLALADEAAAVAVAAGAGGGAEARPPLPVDDWVGPDFAWRDGGPRPPPAVKAALAMVDQNAEFTKTALFTLATDAKHLDQDIDAEVEKSERTLADAFPEDRDPLGLGS